jgi:hypothetical protein
MLGSLARCVRMVVERSERNVLSMKSSNTTAPNLTFAHTLVREHGQGKSEMGGVEVREGGDAPLGRQYAMAQIRPARQHVIPPDAVHSVPACPPPPQHTCQTL